jgi:hypothetical protein
MAAVTPRLWEEKRNGGERKRRMSKDKVGSTRPTSN